ncbi:sensor histidine kinase [Actinacidiphila soli]|uniref:sensor histidine kinase n=1 Tax=Actinacidiphila soli TaxID=2487275 RepID=UPI001F0CCDF6|nr:ATP-binding protein [Actinacidiphila soli]
MALLGAATVAYLVVANPSDGTTRLVLAAAVAGCAVILFAAVRGAGAATGWVHGRLGALRSSSARGQEELQRLVEQVQNGERPARRSPEALPEDGDVFTLVAHDLHQAQHAAETAVVQASSLTPGGGSDQRVEVFVNLARRLQSLVHREIQLLDELENQVEDPDLLKGLFYVDHLATRTRRHAENLAVLGGAVSRRQWSRPVTLTEVLRSAIAEVEQYSRVKLVPPIEGTLRGHAVADVIHLVAELVENATMFSAPHTNVLLRAQNVTAGLAIEVEDRGLGMPHADQQQMNGLLADPDRVDIDELLHDGRIGLYVVSALARRHGVVVKLQSNIYGGIQAVVVLPQGLLGAASQERAPKQQTQAQRTGQPAQLAPPQGVAHTSAAIPAPRPHPAPAPLPAEVPLPAVGHSNGSGRKPTSAARHGSDSAPYGPPAAAPGSREPALPARESGAQPGVGKSAPGPVPPVPAAPAGDVTTHHRTAHGVRPQLPQRRGQTHLAPQLRDTPAVLRDEPVVGHDPGLMAAFQRGISLADAAADEEAGPSGRPDAAS